MMSNVALLSSMYQGMIQLSPHQGLSRLQSCDSVNEHKWYQFLSHRQHFLSEQNHVCLKVEGFLLYSKYAL